MKIQISAYQVRDKAVYYSTDIEVDVPPRGAVSVKTVMLAVDQAIAEARAAERKGERCPRT